ncbi:MAG: diguanylate cyclase [Desulforegulaceae bacterium]|nr:diguanylate cyclase [Desulforegulaceae bacterium]
MEKINVLIVDDDLAIRETMKEYFFLSDYNAYTVANAYEALDFLKQNPQTDLVITDIVMPGMNGLELTEKIKNLYNIDVILITGYTETYSYEKAINKGASDIVFKPVRFEELLLRAKRVLREKKITLEKNEMLEKLKKLADTDGLTKLFNSRKFYTELEKEIDRSNRYNHPLSLIMLDIDHFKKFNDSFGHLEGDKVLFRVGKIIRSYLRIMDTAYRYGGEEFTMILPETRSKESEIVAQRIKKKLFEENFTIELNGLKKDVKVTASFGVTQYLPGEPTSSFVKRVDKALYLSKENGRNRVTLI